MLSIFIEFVIIRNSKIDISLWLKLN